MGSALRVAFDYEETAGGVKSCPISVTLRSPAYNVGLTLFSLFPGDMDGLNEPSGHQAGFARSTRRRVEPSGPQRKGARSGLKQP